jgi:hypothetical protein
MSDLEVRRFLEAFRRYLVKEVRPKISEKHEHIARTGCTIDGEMLDKHRMKSYMDFYQLHYAPRPRIVDWCYNTCGLIGNMIGVVPSLSLYFISPIGDEQPYRVLTVTYLGFLLVFGAIAMGKVGERIGYRIGKRLESCLKD